MRPICGSMTPLECTGPCYASALLLQTGDAHRIILTFLGGSEIATEIVLPNVVIHAVTRIIID